MSTQSLSSSTRPIQQNPSFQFVDRTSSERLQDQVSKIFKERIAPLYGCRDDLFSILQENKEFKCRFFTPIDSSSGLLIHDHHKRRRYEGEGLADCLSVEYFDASSPTEYMLNSVIESAKALQAKSISFKVAKASSQMISFLEAHHFRRVRESGSKVWLYGKTLETPVPSHAGQKRRRDEISSSSTPTQPVFKAPSQPRLTSSTIGMKYLKMIIDGRKTIEGRINTGMFAKVSQGENIQFFCRDLKVLCRVKRITPYPTFAKMLEQEGVAPCLPDESSLQRAIDIYARIPSYPERERKFGVVAIQLERL